MKMLSRALAIASIIVLVAGAAAAKEKYAAYVVTGKCTKFEISGRVLTGSCENKMANITRLDYSHTEFIFFLQNDPKWDPISFKGTCKIKQGEDTLLSIDHINGSAAAGECRYENPFKGSAKISCAATIEGNNWTAEFATDGSPPK